MILPDLRWYFNHSDIAGFFLRSNQSLVFDGLYALTLYLCIMLAHDGVSAVRFSRIVSLQLYYGVHVVYVEACVFLSTRQLQ